MVGTRFANSLIQSRKRLTYKQAQAVIDDAKGEGQPYTKGLLESPPNPKRNSRFGPRKNADHDEIASCWPKPNRDCYYNGIRSSLDF